MSLCSYCKKPSRLAAKGLCGTCYARYQRNGTAEYIRPNRSFGVRECSFCGSGIGPFIKSLCRACYQQQYKTGSPERSQVTRLCEAPKCDDEVHAHGLCQRHYMRLRRHGTSEAGRPEDWGTRRKHPMYESWQSMRRNSRRRGGYDPRWNDFWAFLEDMGERPSKHRLFRKNETEPFSKANCEWRAPILGDQLKRDNRRAYRRALYIKRPNVFKSASLRRDFGISLETYNEMLANQGNVCAICRGHERKKHKVTGEVMMLAVDHDHKTGLVRGLLCSACNHGLGNFNDDPAILQAAISYLDSHESLTSQAT